MEEIKQKLDHFVINNKVPHIIFHGSTCVGKRSILLDFIHKIYNNDKEIIKENVMNVNCAYGKGIKFIRDDLKFYAKSNSLTSNKKFKSIILSNADNLTMDAQSALRRCIEQFSHNTRFFMIVENKYKLLNPILSRFCEIYIPENIVQGRIMKKNHIYQNKEKTNELNKEIKSLEKKTITHNELINTVNNLYSKGINCLQYIEYLKQQQLTDKICKTIIEFDIVRMEIKHEKMLFLYIFNYYYFV